MHIDIPDVLWEQFKAKAATVIPSEGDRAAFKVIGSLIQNFIQSKNKSEVLLGTKEAKALSLSEINDDFFNMFLEGCIGLYPDSEKPEVDYLLDCMASVVDTDKRVILLHSVDASHYDKLTNHLAESFGGGEHSIYLMLTRMLIKAYGDRLFVTSVEGDASTVDLEEKNKAMVVLDGVNLTYAKNISEPVVARLLGNLVNIIGNTTLDDYQKFGMVLKKVFDLDDSDLDLFIRNLIDKNAKGKLLVANLHRAPMYATIQDTEKEEPFTIILHNVTATSLRKLDKAQDALTKDLKQLKGFDTSAYKVRAIGFLIYLLDLLNLADETQFVAEFDNSQLGTLKTEDIAANKGFDSLFKK